MSEVLTWAKSFAAENSVKALADLTKGQYTRTAISLYLNDKYPAAVDKLEAALRVLMTTRHCPYLNKEIAAKDCQSRQSRPMPHARQGAMYQHYLACQHCCHKED